MQTVPITEIDVYRATLLACVRAEASDQYKLAEVLRAWVDGSPFHGCPTCDGRAPWRNEPPCATCNGDGFVPDALDKYIVKNENTLCYRQDGSQFFGVLAGSVIRGGHNPLNGPISIAPSDTVRPATLEDFEFFRVSPVGHIA